MSKQINLDFGRPEGAQVEIHYTVEDFLRSFITEEEMKLLSTANFEKIITICLYNRDSQLVLLPAQTVFIRSYSSNTFGVNAFATGNCQLSFVKYAGSIRSIVTELILPANALIPASGEFELLQKKMAKILFSLALNAGTKRILFDLINSIADDTIDLLGITPKQISLNHAYQNTTLRNMRFVESVGIDKDSYPKAFGIEDCFVRNTLREYISRYFTDIMVTTTYGTLNFLLPKCSPKSVDIFVTTKHSFTPSEKLNEKPCSQQPIQKNIDP